MVSPDGTGYLIPENASPVDLNCLLVFYPDDPMYLQALFGSLTYLGTWTAWERDAAKRGRLAAAAWKDANDCTFDAMGCLTELVSALTGINQTLAAIQAAIENQDLSVDNDALVLAVNGVQSAIENQQISLNAGDLLPALTGIQTAIEEQELTCNCGAGGEVDDMGTVNVYCGCGCGSGSAVGGGTIPPGAPNILEPIVILPHIGFDDPENIQPLDDDTCAIVHYMMMQWRNLILGIANGEIGRDTLFSRMESMFYGTWQWVIGTANAMLEVIGLYSVAPGNAVSISSEIDSHYEEMQCAILQGSEQTEIVRRVWDIIESMNLGSWLKLEMKRVAAVVPWENAFQYHQKSSMAGSIGEEYYTRGCPSCVQDAPIYPSPPTGYRWRVGLLSYYSLGGGVTYQISGHVIDVSVPVAGGDRFVQIRFTNYNLAEVKAIALFVELMPSTFHVRSGGWYAAEFDVTPASDRQYVLWANKGAPEIDWGTMTDMESTKAIVPDVGRFDFLEGGGLYRFSCYELVPE